MVVGIDHSKKIIKDLGIVSCGVIRIVKRGLGLRSIAHILGMLDEVKDVLEMAPRALPELADIDPVEAGQLAQAAYQVVLEVVRVAAEPV